MALGCTEQKRDSRGLRTKVFIFLLKEEVFKEGGLGLMHLLQEVIRVGDCFSLLVLPTSHGHKMATPPARMMTMSQAGGHETKPRTQVRGLMPAKSFPLKPSEMKQKAKGQLS